MPASALTMAENWRFNGHRSTGRPVRWLMSTCPPPDPSPAGPSFHAAQRNDGASYVEHVAVAVRDADSAARWYQDRLGMAIVHDERLPTIGVRLVYLMAADRSRSTAAIQLLEPIGDGAVQEFLTNRDEGLHHVCFAVENIEAVIGPDAQEREPLIFRGGRDRRACFLRQSPNGVLVELTETHPSYPSFGS